MSEIITLAPKENPELNYKEIQQMFAELGTWRGLRILERAFFEISDKLCELENSIHNKKYEDAKRIARTLKFLCPQVGFHGLAEVADHIVHAVEIENYKSLPVICDRMMRLGETSLFQITDLPRILNVQ